MEHARRLILGMLLCTFAVLGIPTCAAVVPRHGWSERWGPLVPHKSFPEDCSLCHLPDRWDTLKTDFSFDHARETGHALNGSHAEAACLRCHNDFGPVAAYTERGCGGCHTDPHRAQLGGTCTQCHNERNWRPAGLIAEHAGTRFPLVGVHATAACAQCHTRAPTRDYKGAPTQCEACHQSDLVRARIPDHQANGWVANCERCHRPTGWSGAEFLHTGFPLTGQHAVINCNACHTGGTFTKLPTDCNSCHSDDYDGAPNHSGFPRTCQNCHNTTTWEGAVFNHRFPIEGPHNVDCSVCHVGGNTQTFSCLVCHEHRKSEADDEHKEVAGYVYASASCLQCHPTGKD